MRLIAVALILLLSACQTQPTKVSSNQERKFEGDALTQPIKIVPETIVLDARPAFDFSTAHIPRSINLNWSDFTEPEPAQRGIMQADLFGAARRLARLGISPESHVVVVGNGIYGNGEEGRVAWMLVYMGLSKVQFASLEALKPRVTNVIDTSSIKAVPMWKPEVRTSLNVTRDEVIFAINERGVEKPISFKGGPALVYHIIDVRSEKAYLGKEGVGSRAHVPNMDAINIPWKEFFDKQMRVKTSMAQRLAQVGLDPANRVIVIGEDGVSSAAVTLVLRGLGYKNAGNYAGGLLDLMSTKVR